MFFGKTRHIHLVGIGGSGMSGIAEILVSQGFTVTGSDIRDSDTVKRLRDLGCGVSIGHRGENVHGADVVVISSAISDDNPEVVEARRLKIPVIPRAEMLAELMRMKFSIAIGGTHGKTTTTAMIASVLEAGDLDPTVIDGGKLVSLGSGARLGNSQFMVVEADEAYGSIKRVSSTIAVVTSIDADHLDYYRDIEDIKETFLDFINRVPFYGVAVLCLDQENIQNLIPQIERRFITYGIETLADVTAHEIKYEGPSARYEARFQGDPLGTIHLPMPGKHNVQNSLAAVAVGLELGIDFDSIKRGLEEFKGVHRRFEIVGEFKGVLIVDDYAHNPAKLKATFNAARVSFPNRRIVAVFQPHRYQRVKHLAEEFANSFFQTDVLIVTAIYGAGEKPIDGVTGENLALSIGQHGHRNVTYIPDLQDVVEHLMDLIRPGDILITTGAGDVWRVAYGVRDRLAEK
jgi:UDP-N-acetylmuramate--alanine ligase